MTDYGANDQNGISSKKFYGDFTVLNKPAPIDQPWFP